MGVDFDFQSHINKTKLTASHYQQPVNQLDLVTESTQSTDLQALLQILNLVQGRLRDRFDATEQFVSLMIQMNEDRRLFITFLGRRPQEIRRNNLMENRQGQRRERSPFTNLHERIRQQEREQLPLQRRFDEQERRMSRFDFDFANPFPRSRESHFVPPIETQSQTLSVQQDMNQILPPISRDLNVLDLSIPQHQDESIVQDIVNQEEINNQSIPQTNNETVNQISLNQNSQYPIRPKIIQRQHIEQPTTCWQFLTRIVRNFLRIFR